MRRPRGQMLPPDARDARSSARAGCSTSSWRWGSSPPAPATALGEPIPIDRGRRAHLRPGAGERLVRARHPEVGVPAARPVHRQELRHLHLALGRALDALEPFRCAPPAQDPEPLPYLRGDAQRRPTTSSSRWRCRRPADRRRRPSAAATSSTSTGTCSSSSPTTPSPAATCGPGDLLASGTISGPDEGSYGSLLELTWRGTEPLALPAGGERKFLQDGDTVIMTGWCQGDGYRVGFGEVSGRGACRRWAGGGRAMTRDPAGKPDPEPRSPTAHAGHGVPRAGGRPVAAATCPTGTRSTRWSVDQRDEFWDVGLALRRRASASAR